MQAVETMCETPVAPSPCATSPGPGVAQWEALCEVVHIDAGCEM